MNPLTSVISDRIRIKEFKHQGWRFFFTESIITSSDHLTKLQKLMKLSNMPDCFFENNRAFLVNTDENFGFVIDPKSALHLCNFDEMKIQLMSESNNNANRTVINPLRISNTKPQANPEYSVLDNTSEIFLASPYMGTIYSKKCFPLCLKQLQYIEDNKKEASILQSQQSLDEYEMVHSQVIHESGEQYSEQTDEDIPISKLTEDNPILWFKQIILYEDDYGDHGFCQCVFKFRVMQDCFFGLLRTYVRVDNNLVRIYDTRIYHEFGSSYMLRVFEERDNTWVELINKGFQFVSSWLNDQQQSHHIEQFMDVKKLYKEKIYFKSIS